MYADGVLLSSLPLTRFAIRPATLGDAAAIARVQTDSWQSSYRGILPDAILATMDPVRRTPMRREILRDPAALNLVAYDTTFGDVVGFANAGPARDAPPTTGELFEIYIVEHAKRFGLGRELLDTVTDWCRAQRMTSLVIWVLDQNQHARRFYEAMGGRLSASKSSMVRGHAVLERSYVWSL